MAPVRGDNVDTAWGEAIEDGESMTDSARIAEEAGARPSDLSIEELEEELTFSAYDVHHVRGRRYEALLMERKRRAAQGGRFATRASAPQSTARA